MEKLLNKLLADLVVEYHKLQHFHWFVKGGDFFTVHAKLEEYYDEINETVDAVAELMLMNGMKPASTMKEFLKLSGIEEPKAGYVKTDAVFKAVIADFESLLKSVVAVKKAADKAGNDLISTKMDDYVEHFTKALWMMKQTTMK
ncbi:MAG: DNA starvation/stationary phase protection protein [Oscillospiraceae bacterium]|nr:DNA starvation/stationary phase protection protein [Oscillospiraceae bacterium]